MSNTAMLTGGAGLQAREWGKALLIALVAVVFLIGWQMAFASDGVEFAEANTKLESWIKGNLGKAVSLIALVFGAFICAVRKDWSWLANAIFIAVVLGVVVGMINSSFTAVI